jgi:hypothetical protein
VAKFNAKAHNELKASRFLKFLFLKNGQIKQTLSPFIGVGFGSGVRNNKNTLSIPNTPPAKNKVV